MAHGDSRLCSGSSHFPDLAPRADESGGEENPELAKASSGELGSLRVGLGKCKRRRGGVRRGVIREALKEERGAQTGSERKESRGGVGGDGSGQDAAPCAGRWGGGGGGVRAGPRAQAGRAAVTSRPGPLPLARWVGPRRAERARGQGGGRGGAG